MKRQDKARITGSSELPERKQRHALKVLLQQVHRCRECVEHLPYRPRPVLAASVNSPIVIIGQAPGKRVHESGIPWDDPSGVRLREWLGVDTSTFYDESLIALLPMGFCYPGTGKSGDLPPRPECAPLWHSRLLEMMPEIRLTLLVGKYAQHRYLHKGRANKTLTQTVADWKTYRPRYLPLPHPSPRNNIWMSKNEWFANEVLPYLKRRTRRIIADCIAQR